MAIKERMGMDGKAVPSLDDSKGRIIVGRAIFLLGRRVYHESWLKTPQWPCVDLFRSCPHENDIRSYAERVEASQRHSLGFRKLANRNVTVHCGEDSSA